MAPESDLLSKLRHDLKTPLNQLIGYGEMLLEDAESEGNEKAIGILRGLLEDARACLNVQSKALLCPPEEVTGQVWDHLNKDHTGRVALMNVRLGELRSELSGSEALADLDRLSQALTNLAELAQEAPGLWETRTIVKPAPVLVKPAPVLVKPAPVLVKPAPVLAKPAPDLAKPVFSTAVEASYQPDREPSGITLGHLLVVDDNEINRDVLSRRLVREGYIVSLAVNGREAMEKLERETFDLVLLDIIMPELDGFAVLQRLRSNPRWKDTPVIMISALDEIANVVRCIEMGAEDYLPKPFDPVLLRARIGALLDRKRLRDEERQRAVRMEAAFREAELQKQAAERTLRNILPEKVATELLEHGSVAPMYFEDVTIGFTDFVGFTLSTEQLAAEELVGLLHEYFTAFDHIMARYGLEKMKTIGDSYMFASGLPERQPSHPVDAVLAALEMVEVVKNMARPNGLVDWKIRVGLHTGPVIAGVVGIHKFAFDIWGDSVNFASRMESSSESNRVNLSERTYARVKDFIRCTPRGRIKTKDGREVDMFFAENIHEKLMDDRNIAPPPAFGRRYKIYFQKEPKAFPEFLLRSDPVGGS